MALTNTEIRKLIKDAGIGDNYNSQDVGFGKYPIANKVRQDIVDGKLDHNKSILFVNPSWSAVHDLHMVARFMVYPLRRTAYVGAPTSFYGLFLSDDFRMINMDDERGYLYAKQIFIPNFCLSKDADKRYDCSIISRVEDYIIDAKVKENRNFHLHSFVPLDQMSGYSLHFRDFMRQHYTTYSV